MTIVQNFYLLWLGHVDYRTVVSVSWLVQMDLKNLSLKKLEKKINCHDLIPGMSISTILGNFQLTYLSNIFSASTDWTCLHIKVTINWKKRFFMRFEKPEDSDKSNDDVIQTSSLMTSFAVNSNVLSDGCSRIYLFAIFVY